MNVTIEQLLQVIGEQTVELALLRREVARLTPPVDQPATPPAGPVAVQRQVAAAGKD